MKYRIHKGRLTPVPNGEPIKMASGLTAFTWMSKEEQEHAAMVEQIRNAEQKPLPQVGQRRIADIQNWLASLS